MERKIFGRELVGYRSFAIAIVVAIFLMIFDWKNDSLIRPVRELMHHLGSPLNQLATYPENIASWTGQQLTPSQSIRRENTALRAELFQARARLLKLAELSAENARLKGLLETSAILDGRMQLAEIVGVDANPRRHILIINRGSKDHVYDGQTVLDDRGVMGQVVEVYPRTARVLLLSDRENAAAVRIERTGMRGVLAGTGDSNLLRLEYVPNTADVRVGDRLITSGLGTRFPAGYPVGVVSQINRPTSNEFASIAVKPMARLEGGHHVILLYAVPLRREQQP